MACKLGEFEGTWVDLLGPIERRLVVKKNGCQYSLSIEGCDDPIHDDLIFDNVACTLKNGSACLSLFHNCGYLFGIEESSETPNTFEVWGAERVKGGSDDESDLSEQQPNWRLDEGWIVRATTGDPPVLSCDPVVISEHPGPSGPGLYQIAVWNKIFDDLYLNEINRTLDSTIRSVAFWRRESPLKSFIFGMVIVSEEVQEKLKSNLSDIRKVKEILRKTGLYLSFEIDILAEGLVDPMSQSSIGVWGAEEG